MNIANLCLICRKTWTSKLNGCCTQCTKKYGISEVKKMIIHNDSENVISNTDNCQNFVKHKEIDVE